ncbi:MAG TPA: hypothetical protein PKO06_25155, partial [Candidatus Ozemobacteraceae bacterium]|nr:hypothetical protein [Candidatus Ozemobacteraceae bacterium]
DAPAAHGAVAEPAAHGAPTTDVAHEAESGHGEQGGHAAAKAAKVTLVESGRLKALDEDRHREQKIDKVELPKAEPRYGIIGVIVLLALGFGLVVFLSAQSGAFAKYSLAFKLYAGFAAIIVLMICMAVASNSFASQTQEALHQVAAATEMEMMAMDIKSLLFEYLVYGLEDQKRADEVVKKAHEELDEFSTDAKDMQKGASDPKESEALDRVVAIAAGYRKGFDSLVTAFDRVRSENAELRKAGQEVEHAVAEQLHHHEKELQEIQKRKGTDPRYISQQTELVTMLSEIELRVTQIESRESAFLLEKSLTDVHELEQLFGELNSQLQAAIDLLL